MLDLFTFLLFIAVPLLILHCVYIFSNTEKLQTQRRMAKDSGVSISIYDATGAAVRRLQLGHREVGHYTSRSRAAYWDGRNRFGEPVASGIYFYTLTAGDFTATKKMLILK